MTRRRVHETIRLTPVFAHLPVVLRHSAQLVLGLGIGIAVFPGAQRR